MSLLLFILLDGKQTLLGDSGVGLGGGGGLYLTSLYSTSPPQGEVGGKLGPSEIDVSSIAPTSTVSSAIGLYGNYACIVQIKRQ